MKIWGILAAIAIFFTTIAVSLGLILIAVGYAKGDSYATTITLFALGLAGFPAAYIFAFKMYKYAVSDSGIKEKDDGKIKALKVGQSKGQDSFSCVRKAVKILGIMAAIAIFFAAIVASLYLILLGIYSFITGASIVLFALGLAVFPVAYFFAFKVYKYAVSDSGIKKKGDGKEPSAS